MLCLSTELKQLKWHDRSNAVGNKKVSAYLQSQITTSHHIKLRRERTVLVQRKEDSHTNNVQQKLSTLLSLVKIACSLLEGSGNKVNWN